jgi:glutaredoxin|tara:strand:- start:46 stop:309 length:264 start_codon:yes stop_codon:yes gene_type:complete
MDKYFLYSQEGCEFCDDLKKVLDENSIRYKIKDVVRNRVEWEKVRMSQKIKYTPVFVIANADRRDVRFLAVDKDFDTPEELIKILKK